MSASLAALGENGLLRLLTANWKVDPRRIFAGVGDDCAVLRGDGKSALLFKTDAVVEGVHFLPSEKPELIGRKALCRALSDLAAMGATPLAAVITLGVAKHESLPRLKGIYAGGSPRPRRNTASILSAAKPHARRNSSSRRAPRRMPRPRPDPALDREPGELIAVTGKLGGTQSNRRHLLFEPRLAEGQWLAKKKFATAMMDLSDGLGADLPRLAEASRVSFHLAAEQIPRTPNANLSAALNDGEDFELLFTVRPERAKSLKKEWPFTAPLHFIGVTGRRGVPSGFPRGTYGFDHFKQH